MKTHRTRFDGKTVTAGLGRILIGQQFWTVVISPHEFVGIWGAYDYRLKLILIDGTATEEKLMDTLLHEVSHILDRGRPERAVLRQGQILSSVMTQFGYKR